MALDLTRVSHSLSVRSVRIFSELLQTQRNRLILAVQTRQTAVGIEGKKGGEVRLKGEKASSFAASPKSPNYGNLGLS
jgi:hypothetical protein